MKMINILLLILLASFPAAAQVLYQGKVGTMAVVMEIDEQSDGSVIGRYFYRKYHRDLMLWGKRQGDTLYLAQGRPNWDKPLRPDMVLNKYRDGWRGQWVNGKKRPVLFTSNVARGLVLNSDVQPWPEATAYALLRLQDLSLKPSQQQKWSGYQLTWLVEPISGVRQFRLVDNKGTLAKLNQYLARRHWRDIEEYFSCTGGEPSQGGMYRQTVTPHYLSEKLFSASFMTEYYCGGAHPDFADQPLNIDLTTGKELALSDVLAITPRHNPNGATEEQDLALGLWLLGTFKQLYPSQMQGDPEGCDYRDPNVWQYPIWHITEQGLYIGPSFARYARACEYPTWSLLPWSAMKANLGSRADLLPYRS